MDETRRGLDDELYAASRAHDAGQATGGRVISVEHDADQTELAPA